VAAGFLFARVCEAPDSYAWSLLKRLPLSLLMAALAGFIAHACLNPQPTPPHERDLGGQPGGSATVGGATSSNASAAATSGGEAVTGTSDGVGPDSGSSATTGGHGGKQGEDPAAGGAAGAGGEAGSPVESP